MSEWRKQDKNSVSDLDELKKVISLSPNESEQLEKVCNIFRMKITRYYLNLIDKKDPLDPLRKMAVPHVKERVIKKDESDDPIGDENTDHHPIKAITHRYPDRVLLYPTPECGGHCRYCFRRRMAGNSGYRVSENELAAGYDYIKKNDAVHEVILSGGDPLMSGDYRLKEILESLRKIPHVWTLRIHTRMPAWNPFRITERLVGILSKAKPLCVVTHFNHARELTDIAVKYLARLRDSGIMLLNQSVLLKGVNDSTYEQIRLGWALIRAGVKPYYLHHLDKAKGTSHFRVDMTTGKQIQKQMRGALPGYAIPHYVLDIPGGYGKIPLEYDFLTTDEKGRCVAETRFGEFRPYQEL